MCSSMLGGEKKNMRFQPKKCAFETLRAEAEALV